MLRKTPGYVDIGSALGKLIFHMTSVEAEGFSTMSSCLRLDGDPHCDNVGLMRKTW